MDIQTKRFIMKLMLEKARQARKTRYETYELVDAVRHSEAIVAALNVRKVLRTTPIFNKAS